MGCGSGPSVVLLIPPGVPAFSPHTDADFPAFSFRKPHPRTSMPLPWWVKASIYLCTCVRILPRRNIAPLPSIRVLTCSPGPPFCTKSVHKTVQNVIHPFINLFMPIYCTHASCQHASPNARESESHTFLVLWQLTAQEGRVM